MTARIATMTKLVVLPRNEIDAQMDHVLQIVVVDLHPPVPTENKRAKMAHVKTLVLLAYKHQTMDVEAQVVVGMVLVLLDPHRALQRYSTLDTLTSPMLALFNCLTNAPMDSVQCHQPLAPSGLKWQVVHVLEINRFNAPMELV
jgi:hypothetical protein